MLCPIHCQCHHVQAKLALLVPYLRGCKAVPFLTIRGTVSNPATLAEAFANLRVVTGDLYVNQLSQLATLHGAFPALRTIGTAPSTILDSHVLLGSPPPQTRRVVSSA